MADSEQRYLCGAAYARAVWTPPSTPQEQLVWKRWLKGLSTIVVSTAALALLLASETTNRPLEATVQMERLATKLEQMKVIHPETAQAIANLVVRPSYDCDQVTCSTQVYTRNSAARSRLQAVLASDQKQAGGVVPTTDISASSSKEPGRK
jgi:HAMP domain-containing protein